MATLIPTREDTDSASRYDASELDRRTGFPRGKTDWNASEFESSRGTPFFLFDRARVETAYHDYVAALPMRTEICYAVKSNSEPEVLGTLAKLGSSFEIASRYELKLVQDLDVPPSRVVFGTAVKSVDDIAAAYQAGVRRFAADSEQEVVKLSRVAPKSKVFIRALVDDRANSVYTMSKKFGVSPTESLDLLLLARKHGLVPYGLSFNVGSQARNAEAWANGITSLIPVVAELRSAGIQLSVLNVGGGFPHLYRDGDDFPSVGDIGRNISRASRLLPYEISYLAEPGRGLVAGAYSLVVSVIGKIRRPSGHWLYLDAGAYNALLEALACQGSIRYTIGALTPERGETTYILTGPTGDALDVIDPSAVLPESIDIGDRLVIRDVGAYTFPLITAFNGFPRPPTIQI